MHREVGGRVMVPWWWLALTAKKGLWTSGENAYHPKRYGFSVNLIFMTFWGRDDYETRRVEFA